MSTEDARQKLREFYKLQSQEQPAQPAPVQEALSITNEDAELNATSLDALDAPDANAEEFVNNLIQNVGLVQFIQISDQVRREKLTLASAQRELVNDNYRKLIQAAETLGYLSKQGDLAGIMDLTEPVNAFAKLVEEIPEQL